MTITRRQHLLALASLLSLFASSGDGMNVSAKDGKIELIAQLADLLVKTTEAISKFGDSIAHLVTLGAQGYDAAAARKAHADLIELRANLEKLVSGANLPLIRSINEYVERHRRTPKPQEWERLLWRAVVEKVENATVRVNALLEEVSKIRNDFVLEDAYRTIHVALHGRTNILMHLRALPAPVEEGELEALGKAGTEYQKLTEATQKASEQVAAYIKSLK